MIRPNVTLSSYSDGESNYGHFCSKERSGRSRKTAQVQGKASREYLRLSVSHSLAPGILWAVHRPWFGLALFQFYEIRRAESARVYRPGQLCQDVHRRQLVLVILATDGLLCRRWCSLGYSGIDDPGHSAKLEGKGRHRLPHAVLHALAGPDRRLGGLVDLAAERGFRYPQSDVAQNRL